MDTRGKENACRRTAEKNRNEYYDELYRSLKGELNDKVRGKKLVINVYMKYINEKFSWICKENKDVLAVYFSDKILMEEMAARLQKEGMHFENSYNYNFEMLNPLDGNKRRVGNQF